MNLPSRLLVCAECGRASDHHAQGWRALLVSDDDEQPLRDDATAMFCPDCWRRELGDQ